MHICMIAPEQFTVPGDGSVEICIWNIARRLAKRHKVTIVSRRAAGLPDTDELEQVQFIRLPSGTPSRYRSSVLTFLEASEPFDLIQIDNRPRLAAAVKRQYPVTPVMIFLHSLTFVPQEPGIARCLALADAVTANSSSLEQRLIRRFPASAASFAWFLWEQTCRASLLHLRRRRRACARCMALAPASRSCS